MIYLHRLFTWLAKVTDPRPPPKEGAKTAYATWYDLSSTGQLPHGQTYVEWADEHWPDGFPFMLRASQLNFEGGQITEGCSAGSCGIDMAGFQQSEADRRQLDQIRAIGGRLDTDGITGAGDDRHVGTKEPKR